jgi:hypothetical protein
MSAICLGYMQIPGCGHVLTDEERYYYGSCCEDCMTAWSDEIAAWRKGGENAELDAIFDVPPPTRQ